MPLEVAIIGAGIAGLCAAVALRQAGHKVRVFEKSAFATEIGAALGISPNGARVLNRLGFSFDKARACPLQSWVSVDGATLESLSAIELDDCVSRFGGPFVSIHRVDFHKELLRLAKSAPSEGLNAATIPVEINLSSEVRELDREHGSFVLSNGTVIKPDLIVGADGVHSVVRQAVIDSDAVRVETASSAFRLLIPTSDIEKVDELDGLMSWKCKSNGATILADLAEKQRERHMAWYRCRGGEVQNIVGIHPTRHDAHADTDCKAALVEEFAHFHPDVVKMIKLAERVQRWNLEFYEPFESWTYNNIVLVGDAAHPMLPFGGQAANQALEDGAALSYFLRDVEDSSALKERLKIYQDDAKRRWKADCFRFLRCGHQIFHGLLNLELKMHSDTIFSPYASKYRLVEQIIRSLPMLKEAGHN